MSERRAVGSVRQAGRGRWIVQVSAGWHADGRRRRVTRRVRGRRADAERELARLLQRAGAPAPPQRMTLEAYLEDQWLPTIRPRLRARTIEGYESKIRTLIVPHLGRRELARITPMDLERWLAELRETGGARGAISERTILAAYRILRAALRQAVRWQILERDPSEAVAAPRPVARDVQALDVDGARALLAGFAGHPLEPLVALALGTGMRRSEILGLRWQQVDLDAGELEVVEGLHETRGGLRFEPPKSARSRRRIALPTWTVAILRAHRLRQLEIRVSAGGAWADADLVLAGSAGGPLTPSEVTRRFRRQVEAAGLPPIALKDLRHSHATLALRAGADVAVVSRRLGHSTISVTDTFYLRPGREPDRDAARGLEDLHD